MASSKISHRGRHGATFAFYKIKKRRRVRGKGAGSVVRGAVFQRVYLVVASLLLCRGLLFDSLRRSSKRYREGMTRTNREVYLFVACFCLQQQCSQALQCPAVAHSSAFPLNAPPAEEINLFVTQEQGDCLICSGSMCHLICGWLSQIKHVVCKDTAAQVALC